MRRSAKCCQPAAQSQAKLVYDRPEALPARAISSQDTVIEALAKNATAAKNAITPKPPRQDRELYPPPTKRQIYGPALIAALHAPGADPAVRADSSRLARSWQDLQPVHYNLHCIYRKTRGREARTLENMLHLLIILLTSANLGRGNSKCESEPLLDENPGSHPSDDQHG